MASARISCSVSSAKRFTSASLFEFAVQEAARACGLWPLIRSILNSNRLALTTRSDGVTPGSGQASPSGGKAGMIATHLKVLRRVIEMAVQRVVDVLGRLTRGMTLGVRGLVIGPDGRIFLV